MPTSSSLATITSLSRPTISEGSRLCLRSSGAASCTSPLSSPSSIGSDPRWQALGDLLALLARMHRACTVATFATELHNKRVPEDDMGRWLPSIGFAFALSLAALAAWSQDAGDSQGSMPGMPMGDGGMMGGMMADGGGMMGGHKRVRDGRIGAGLRRRQQAEDICG